ncbi:hypothetical protein K435DRAFT_275932 [Dendrothele bispora CBS 962.96]|uniref:Uncharacterized protein n=1 Tax=Dendrothele bispora (strain CBS 962.96) TaxID=1314807 RepID=A0A4S8KJ96_DENBC|nr:hypothetical protein K435DRAFT_275932 [Dendrothele bispora CBS 962.96]
MQVWEDCSPIVKWYIHHRFLLAKIEIFWKFSKFLDENAFIRRDTGMICFGSQGPSNNRASDLLSYAFTSGTPGISLPFNLYFDEAGLKEYLLRMLGQKHPLVSGPPFIRISYFLHAYSLDGFTSTGAILLPSVLWRGHDELRKKLIGSFKNMDQSYSYTLEPWRRCDHYDNTNGKLLGTGWTRWVTKVL